jgi:SAM-dependent methyltransferase
MAPSRVETQFGRHAAEYATSPVHAQGASLQRVLELLEAQPQWHVLDVATGAGHMAAALAPYVARVVAADLTPQMLEEARKLAAARGLENFVAVRADAAALPFASESFDVVTCRIAAHHFADPHAFAVEACRVLRDGGRLALVDNVAPDRAIFPAAAGADLADAAASYNGFEKLRDPSHGRCLGLEEWRELLTGAGFVVTHCERLAKEMDLRPWADRMGASPATRERLASLLRGSAGLLRAFLAPREEDGRLHFTLHEGIVVAARPGRETARVQAARAGRSIEGER